MATSRITIYHTNIKPSDNYIIEDIDAFLDSTKYCDRLVTIDNFQYQRTEYLKQVKVNLSQNEVDNFKMVPDYMKVEMPTRTFYYFILGDRQVSQETVQFDLMLDVLNTFDGSYNFTDKSQVERMHIDRFRVDRRPENDEFTEFARHLYSRTTENLQPQLYRKSLQKVVGKKAYDSNRWYLIYETDKTSGVPIMEMCADNPLNLHKDESTTGTFEITLELCKNNSYVSFGYITLVYKNVNTGQTTTAKNLYGTLSIVGKVVDGDDAYIVTYVDNLDSSRNFKNTYRANTLTRLSATPNTPSATVYLNPAYGTVNTDYNYAVSHYTPIVISDDTELVLSTIKGLNRTDSNITRVIECPYCPLELETDTKGRIVIPEGWEYNQETLRLRTTNITDEFLREGLQSIVIKDVSTITMTPAKLESYGKFEIPDPKTLTSPFYGDYYVYDDNTWQLQREFLEYNGTSSALTQTVLTLDYKQSNNISSMLGFKFNITGAQKPLNAGYFDEYVISVRNNELPLFTSDYLYYMQNGYNYDKKNLRWQTLSNIIGVAGQAANFGGLLAGQSLASRGYTKFVPLTAQQVAKIYEPGAQEDFLTGSPDLVYGYGKNRTSLPLGYLKDVKGIASGFSFPSLVSNAVGIGTGIVNTIMSHRQGEEAIENKVNEAKNKAFNVASGDNLNLFQWYSGNNILHMEFIPDKQNQYLINEYFHLYGYSIGTYGKPNMDSRYWFNYCRGNMDITGRDTHYQPFETNKAYIQEKYQEGVYRIHRRPQTPDTWDVRLEHCNVECSLLPEYWCR